MSDKNRFIVVEGSYSAHCCFTHSVIDTINGGECICEAFSQEDAEKIAEALNETIDPEPIVDTSQNIDQTKAVISAVKIIKDEL